MATGRRSTKGTLAVFAMLLALTLAVPLAWWASRPADAVGRSVLSGSPDSSGTATTDPSSTGSTAPGLSPTVTPAPGAGALPRLTARPAVPSDQDVDLPVRLRVSSVGLDARVDPVGVDPAGAMGLPQDIRRVGWYEFGPAPGSAEGSAVLAGHVDGRAQGRGAMAALLGVDTGARVAVTTRSGRTVEYRVVGRERIRKQGLPVDELFRRDGAARLVLITCGGEYDRSRGGYQDNVVVVAEPVR